MLRLLTIPISHYCEKARWALDRAGLGYHEERHVQVVHRLAVRRAGGGSTVPVLVAPDRVIGDSAEIIAWVDAQLEPQARLLSADPDELREIESMCLRFDAGLGPSGRRLMYIHMLPQRRLMLPFNNAGVPRWEDRALRWGWPLAARAVKHALGIVPGVELSDEAAVWREFDFVGEHLADGRPYLCGERFTAADLTFAALSASVLVPEDYGVTLPQPDVMDAATADLVRRARAHPAGQFARRIVAEQRWAVVG